MMIPAVQTSSVWGPATPFPAGTLGVLASPAGYTLATPEEYFSVIPDSVPGGIKNAFSGNLVLSPGYFGCTFHRYPGGTTPAPSIAFDVARSHDYGPGSKRVRWSSIEETQGVFDWSALDDFVTTHRAAGRKIIHTLFGTPAWASARPAESSSYGPGIAAEPANLAHWDAYCAACASRYAGRIDWYEVWNEPNLSSFWSGTQTILAQMVRRANQAIKAIDPSAKIISPATTGWQSGTGSAYLLAMMAAADGATGTMQDWIDAVGVHLYPNNTAGITSLPAMLETVRANMATLGIAAMPLINTEFGVLSPAMQSHGEAQRAAFLARLLLLAAASNAGGADVSVWYDGDPDSTIGLKDADCAQWRAVRELMLSGPITVVNTLRDGRVAATVGGRNVVF